MADSLKDRLKALDERIQYKMRNMNRLDKLYKELDKLQVKMGSLNAQMDAVNTEIKIILNSMKDIENEINATMLSVSTHPDFV